MPTTRRDLWISGKTITDEIVIERLSGRESLGTPFDYEVTLLSESPKVDLGEFIGDTVTAHLQMKGEEPRHFNGYVTKAALVDTFDRYARYRLTLRPFIWLMSPRVNSRIFQHQSVPDIVKKLFREHGFDSAFEEDLSGSYPALDYVVQYRESDFAFVSRLMEGVGIYYFFKHTEDQHLLVLADADSAHATAPQYATVQFNPAKAGTNRELDCLDSLTMEQQLRSGAYASDDFNFESPRMELLTRRMAKTTQKLGKQEVYEYPGGFLSGAAGEENVRTRLEELTKDLEMVSASGDVRGIGSGHLFTLQDFPLDAHNKQYLIVSATFEASVNALESGGDEPMAFRTAIEAIDSTVPFRPTRITPVPRIEGPQTAIVVGAGGDEIFTDKYGRVKVQFHWDREGKGDDNSSCWVRVSQAWAGAQWGAVHLPRVGQEVVVDFLEGDPDRPIIVGRVYNADNMVPYALPANKTQSGIKSRSSLGGGAANFNELRFEDKKGSEEVYLHAEKDWNIVVEQDEGREVGHDRTKKVGNDETTKIGHDRSETVANDETIDISGERSETVGKSESVTVTISRDHTVGAKESLTVGATRTVMVGASDSTTVGGSQSVSVGAGQTVTVGKDQATSVGAGRTLTVAKDDSVTIGGKSTESIEKDANITVGAKMVIDVTDELTLKSGDASIILKKNGDITIKGKNITVDGSGKVNIKASGDVVIKGSKIAGN
ncbi:MAG TPA: type VI secretion system tip protein TssI/VgrG [Polyangia bacterium]|jgi:type VI secretion system secreted protein VgrG